jgi:hypothetical protein
MSFRDRHTDPIQCLEHLDRRLASCDRCEAWQAQVSGLSALSDVRVPGAPPSFSSIVDRLAADRPTDAVADELSRPVPAPEDLLEAVRSRLLEPANEALGELSRPIPAPSHLAERVFSELEADVVAGRRIAPVLRAGLSGTTQAPRWLDQRVRATTLAETASRRRLVRRAWIGAAAAVLVSLGFLYLPRHAVPDSHGTSAGHQVVVVDSDLPLDPSFHVPSILRGRRGNG